MVRYDMSLAACVEGKVAADIRAIPLIVFAGRGENSIGRERMQMNNSQR
jgi:hypothetical protein